MECIRYKPIRTIYEVATRTKVSRNGIATKTWTMQFEFKIIQKLRPENHQGDHQGPSWTIIFFELKLITGPICRYQFGRTYQRTGVVCLS